MGLIAKEKYEQRKIDRLAEHLKVYAEKGKPIDFEIIVDGFKVVRRTSDLEMFNLYENYVDADTKSIEFLFYSGSSNTNDKHIFYLGNVSRQSLEGVDVQDQIDSGVQQRLREQEFMKLQQDNAALDAEIKALEKEVAMLEKVNAELEATRSPLNGFLGDIGSSLVESFIRRNPNVMSSIPGGQVLAGLLDRDPVKEESTTSETEVTFKPATEGGATVAPLTEDQQYAIAFVDQLKAQFTKAEFDKIMLLLQVFAGDKQKIDISLAQLNINTQ